MLNVTSSCQILKRSGQNKIFWCDISHCLFQWWLMFTSHYSERTLQRYFEWFCCSFQILCFEPYSTPYIYSCYWLYPCPYFLISSLWVKFPALVINSILNISSYLLVGRIGGVIMNSSIPSCWNPSHILKIQSLVSIPQYFPYISDSTGDPYPTSSCIFSLKIYIIIFTNRYYEYILFKNKQICAIVCSSKILGNPKY